MNSGHQLWTSQCAACRQLTADSSCRRKESSRLQQLLTATCDLLYPPVCTACGREPAEGHWCGQPSGLERGPLLCDGCCLALAPPVEAVCRRCSAPVGPHLDTERGCIHCSSDRFPFAAVYSLGVYTDRLQEACLRLKHPGSEPLAWALADLLWRRNRSVTDGPRFDLVTGIPQTAGQQLMRRVNASYLVGERLARRLQATFHPHILARLRTTPRQATLTASARRTNLRGAFGLGVAPRTVRGRTILLADDVLTTGTTAAECSRVLIAAGAAEVHVAVLARGLGSGGRGAASRAGSAAAGAERLQHRPPADRS